MCRASTCSAGRSTARSCWWPCWLSSPASCWPTTCGRAPARRRWRMAAVTAGALALIAWAVRSRESPITPGMRCARCARLHRSRWRPSGPVVGGEVGARAHRRGRLRCGAGGRRTHLVQRRLEPQRRATGLLLGAAASGRRRRAGAVGSGTGDRRAAHAGRKATRRGRRRERLVAEPGHDARAGGDQRLQSAAHRLLRPPGLARRDHAHRRPAAVPGVVRRLRLRARARVGPGIRRARPAHRGGAASGAPAGVGRPAGRAQHLDLPPRPIPSRASG